MSEIALLSLAVVGLVVLGAALFSWIDPSWRRLYHPWLIISSIMAAYTLTPVLAGANGRGDEAMVRGFLRLMVLTLTSLLVGMALAHGLPERGGATRHGAVAPASAHGELPRWMLVAATIAWLVTVDRFDGGLVRVVTKGYLTGEELAPNEVIWLALGVFTLMGLLCAGLLVHGLSWSLAAVSTLFVILNLLGGHRNFVTMFVGAMAAMASLRSGRVRYSLAGPGAALAFVSLMLVGIVRNTGLAGLSLAMDIIRTAGWQVLNPNSQELGTSFRVYQTALSEGSFMFQGWTFWESATRLFASLIPRVFWPTRPPPPSEIFSAQLAGPGEGLGFSVPVETFVGGGYPVCVVVFVLIGVFSVLVYRAAARPRPSGLAVGAYATLFLVAFNINRIDLQTTVKLSLLLSGSVAGCLLVLREDPRALAARLWSRVMTMDLVR